MNRARVISVTEISSQGENLQRTVEQTFVDFVEVDKNCPSGGSLGEDVGAHDLKPGKCRRSQNYPSGANFWTGSPRSQTTKGSRQSQVSLQIMIVLAPDSQLRVKGKGYMKSCSPTETSRSKSCPAKISNEKVVCSAQFFKKGGRKLCARPNFQDRLPALFKKASVGPTRARQVHRILATKTLCGPRIVRMRLCGTLQQL